MGNSSSRGYDSRRQYPSGHYYPDPGWSSTRGKRLKGVHPAVRPPPDQYYQDEGENYEYPQPPRRQHAFPEPGFADEYGYDPSMPHAQPAHIPFPAVHQQTYGQPVIPNIPHPRSRGHTYPAPPPPMQMPAPVIPQSQPQSMIPPPPVIPQFAPSSSNIPYPDANAPILPPGQTFVFPPPSSRSAQPGVHMPEPHPQPLQASVAVPADQLAPGQYGPNDGIRRSPRRSPDHRRARSHNNHHDDGYYDRPRHRYSIDSSRHYYQHRDSPLRNPLPRPPSDVFERPGVAELLTQLRLPPEESTLKRDPSAPTHALIIPPNGAARIERVHARPLYQQYHQQQQLPRERGLGEKKKGGLFRSLSAKLKPKHREPHHYYRDDGGIPIQDLLSTQPVILTAEEQMLPPQVPPIIPPPPILGSDAEGSQAPAPPPGQFGPPDDMSSNTPYRRMPSPSPSGRSPRSPTPSQRPPPPPPHGSTPQPSLRIDDSNYLAPLLHFSHHPVHYLERVYPTAYHLYEAMKFMQDRPDVAERIRTSGGGLEGVNRAGSISREFARQVRPDWNEVMVQMMEDALYEKFVQHAEARSILFATGDSNLFFADAGDDFWGDGPIGQGLNQIGKILIMC